MDRLWLGRAFGSRSRPGLFAFYQLFQNEPCRDQHRDEKNDLPDIQQEAAFPGFFLVFLFFIGLFFHDPPLIRCAKSCTRYALVLTSL